MPLYTYHDILPASVFVFFYPEAPKIIGGGCIIHMKKHRRATPHKGHKHGSLP